MPELMWQQLGVLVLAFLFSLLFTSMNQREQKTRERGGKI